MPNPRPDAGHDGDYEPGYDRSLDRRLGRLLSLVRSDLEPDAIAAAEEALARGEYESTYLEIVAAIEASGESLDPDVEALLDRLREFDWPGE